jgi:hypothetical protein
LKIWRRDKAADASTNSAKGEFKKINIQRFVIFLHTYSLIGGNFIIKRIEGEYLNVFNNRQLPTAPGIDMREHAT